MPHFTESLDALRREAPARFLETDQFAEMLSTYHKLKPLSLSKPKSFAKQCAEYDFTRIYPLMDAFLAEHDLSAPDSVELCEAQNVSVLSRVFTSLGQGVFSVVEYFS